MEQIETLAYKKRVYLICFIIFGLIALAVGIAAIFKQDAGLAVVASFNMSTAIATIVSYADADLKIEFLKQIETLRNEQKEQK